MLVRSATETDVPRVAEITIEAYVGDGLIRPDSPYAEVLGDARSRYATGGLLVAEHEGVVAGSALFAAAGSAYRETAERDEAEFRMLAVAKAFRGRGVGAELVRVCIGQAMTLGCPMLRLSTQEEMSAARRLYARLGFVRTPERDWDPIPEVHLITYALDLTAHCPRCGRARDDAHDEIAHGELDPPRYCGCCGRRLVVQVTPSGWTARCSLHGVRRSA